MISEIIFKSLKTSKLFSYAADLKYFKENKRIQFKPGLNILFGPNGCGKSTILNMAAIHLAAAQGGVSTVTQSWIDQAVDSDIFEKREPKSNLGGVTVKHDGQPVMYGNPREAVGLRSGRFDDDFMMKGVLNATDRSSTGFKTLNRLNDMFHLTLHPDEFPKEIQFVMNRKSVNSAWKAKFDVVDALLTPSIPKGQPTFIFDEPESGLALPIQANIFTTLHNMALEKGIQVIAASHSPFCLGLPHANYIDMEPGNLAYIEECVSLVHQRIVANNERIKGAK